MAATLPLFPLGTVLLPGTPLPLHIFEPRYRQLTVDLVTGEVPARRFGVVATREGHEPGPDNLDPMHPVGCSAALRQARRLPDGRYNVLTRGADRFRLLDVDDASAPYLVARVEWEPDDQPDQQRRSSLPALDRAARAAYRQYCAAARPGQEPGEPAADTDPAVLAYLLAAECMLTEQDRQGLLEQRCPAERLRAVRSILVREATFLRALHAVPAGSDQLITASTRN